VTEFVDLLRNVRLCEGLAEDELRRFAAFVTGRSCPAGEYVCRSGEPSASVYIVIAGRLRGSVALANGQEQVVGHLNPGDSFGEYSLLDAANYPLNIRAVEDTQLLVIERGAFLNLFESIPRIGVNLVRALGVRLKQAYGLQNPDVVAKTVGVVAAGPTGWAVLGRLCDALTAAGERLARRTGVGAHEDWEALKRSHDRIVAAYDVASWAEVVGASLAGCDTILWLVDAKNELRLRAALNDLLSRDSSAADRVLVVWLLDAGRTVAPRWHAAWSLPQRHSVIEPEDSFRGGQSVARLARRLRGVTLGLALAGGGARGMAHLGVLRAFDRAGIGFDVMAGTSCGAMAGITYAAGYTPDFAVEAYTRDLTPPWPFRLIPRGTNWYLLSKYRSGAWESMLRKYFHDWRLEEFAIPFATLTVDLVRGTEVVRDSGDAVHAMLESINLPGVARPINRDGMALVDGGILNNLPADLLTMRGADFVVAVDVTTRLKAEFAGSRPETPTEKMRRAGTLETLFRVLDVQARGLNAFHTRSVDLMIEPDTSAFTFVDFTKTPRLAEVGEAVAEQAVPRLKELLADLKQRTAASRAKAGNR
jgi:predicted acylesterase/phospholipase RssA/CRP-like cAMP-binding protein